MRRPVKDGEQFFPGREYRTPHGVLITERQPAVVRMQGRAFGLQGPFVKWQVGRTYAVQPGRGKCGVGRVRLTAIRREALKDISHGDAVAEVGDWGCDTLQHFQEVWQELHAGTPHDWDSDPDVWVLMFELA